MRPGKYKIAASSGIVAVDDGTAVTTWRRKLLYNTQQWKRCGRDGLYGGGLASVRGVASSRGMHLPRIVTASSAANGQRQLGSSTSAPVGTIPRREDGSRKIPSDARRAYPSPVSEFLETRG